MSIPSFPILYKKNTQWKIEIKKKQNYYMLVMTFGTQDGKQITTTRDIPEGKVKRSVLEQAIQEATRKWKNKKEKELYSETDSPEDAQEEIRPMLAQKFEPSYYEEKTHKFVIPFPLYVQPKLDGIRCLASVHRMESRTGIPFDFPFDMIRPILTKMLTSSPSILLDGELFTEKLPFEKISGLLHAHVDKMSQDDINNMNLLEYHVYDCINLENKEMPFYERNALLKKMFQEKYAYNNVIYVPTYSVKSIEEVFSYHRKFVEDDGQEGTMIRDKNGPYEINKRSKYLQKFKDFMDDEFKIVGYEPDTNGCLKWICTTKEGKNFKVVPLGTTKYKISLMKKGKKYIGKMLTVKYTRLNEDGIPINAKGKGVRNMKLM